ncbi:MAG: hypothetical protein R2831_10875 [Chitinophagaceae bacterium]
MNIQYLVDNYAPEVQQVMLSYGINAPVNRETVSSALVLHSHANGNPLAEDLVNIVYSQEDLDQYDEDFLKKLRSKVFGTKETRAVKREARGGYSRVGALIRKVGIAKNKPARGASAPPRVAAPGIAATPSVLAQDAAETNNTDTTVTNSTGTGEKITGGQVGSVLGALGNAVSDIYSAIKPDPSGDYAPDGGYDPSGGAPPAPKEGFKKYLPFIIGGAFLLVVVLVFAFKSKK